MTHASLGNFGQNSFKMMGLQIDGWTERVNALLELYLRHFVSVNQRDWVKLLDATQFSYHLQRSEVTNKSPFELATKQKPSTPHTLVMGYMERSPMAFNSTREWQEQVNIVCLYLDKATKRMKKWANKKRCLTKY